MSDSIHRRSGALRSRVLLKEKGIKSDPSLRREFEAMSAKLCPASVRLAGPIAVTTRVCDAIETFLAGGDEGRTEFDVVNQAGASIALAICDAMNGTLVARDERYLISFSSFGFSDPFAIVQSALGAEDPYRSLVDDLRSVELEALGKSELARAHRILHKSVSKYDAAVLKRFGPLAVVSVCGTGSFVEIDFGFLLGRGSEELENLVEQLVVLRLGKKDVRKALRLDAVFPRLVPSKFLHEHNGNLASIRLNDEVALTFVEVWPSRFRFLSSKSFVSDFVHSALANLAQVRPPRLRKEREVWMGMTGDGYDSARILLPSVLSKFGPNSLYAIPHRDTFLVAKPSARSNLDSMTKTAYAAAPHGISSSIYTTSELIEWHRKIDQIPSDSLLSGIR